MFNSGLDIVVVAREASASATFEEIKNSLLHLANLHKVTRK
jgi:ribonuclease P protein component